MYANLPAQVVIGGNGDVEERGKLGCSCVVVGNIWYVVVVKGRSKRGLGLFCASDVEIAGQAGDSGSVCFNADIGYWIGGDEERG